MGVHGEPSRRQVTGFQILEHTADTGFRVRAATFEDLLGMAAEGLAGIVLECSAVRPLQTLEIAARGEDREALVVNFLNEVLYAVDGRGFAVAKASVNTAGSHGVTAALTGEPRDDERHRPKLVVKAATYHQLSIRQDSDGWVAEVFLDI